MRRTIWQTFVTILLLDGFLLLAAAKGADYITLLNVEFAQEKGAIEIKISSDSPLRTIAYDVKDPPQIIIDMLDETKTLLPQDLDINKGVVSRVRIIQNFSEKQQADAELTYPVDFLVVDLKKSTPYSLNVQGNIATLVISEEPSLRKEVVQEAPREKTAPNQKEDIPQEGSSIKVRKKKLVIERRAAAPKEAVKEVSLEKSAPAKEGFPEKPGKLFKGRGRVPNIWAKSLRDKGYIFQSQGDLEKAIELYQEAIKLDLEYAAPHNDLGVLYEELGWPDKAIDEYTAALTIDPGYLKAHTNLALLYENKGETGKALFHWQKRAELGEPDDPWTKKAREKVR